LIFWFIKGRLSLGAREGDLGVKPNKRPESAKYHLSSVAFLAKSLSDENRLRILLSVGDGKKSVSSIVEELGLSQPLVSHHLKELKRSLLVKVERNGPFVYYEAADSRIADIFKALGDLAADLLAKRSSF
jgi:DNA-binding transcriptional ArsR family regulator